MYETTDAEARATLNGIVKMAARQMKNSLTAWENLDEDASDWEAETLLRTALELAAPLLARLHSAGA